MIKDYYYDYLTYNKKAWNYSEQRDLPLNFSYYYRLIATQIEGKSFYSVSKDIKDFRPSHDIESTIKKYKGHYEVRKLYRMSLDDYKPPLNNDAVTYDRLLFEKSMKDKPDQVRIEVEKKYKRIIDEERRFLIKDKNKTLAYGLISDVDFGGGNIVIYTHEDHRKKGYGKMLVASCIKWCLDHDIRPIYLVDAHNIPSIRLAEALGFKTFSIEYALSETID